MASVEGWENLPHSEGISLTSTEDLGRTAWTGGQGEIVLGE
jgi:hypothetical protein